MEIAETLDLLDWKRRVFALYAEIRAVGDPEQAWGRWQEVRAELFRDHPQSPLPGYEELAYFPYNPSLRYQAEVVNAEPERRAIGSSGDEPVWFTRFATAHFGGHTLDLFWLDRLRRRPVRAVPRRDERQRVLWRRAAISWTR